jgi:hypothetical protein
MDLRLFPGRRGRTQPIAVCEWLRGWLPSLAHRRDCAHRLVSSFPRSSLARRSGRRADSQAHCTTTTTHTRVDKYAPHAAHQRVLPGPSSTSTVTLALPPSPPSPPSSASPTGPAQPSPHRPCSVPPRPSLRLGCSTLDARRALHSRRPPAHARDARQRPWLTVGAGRGVFQVPRMTPCVGGYWKRFALSFFGLGEGEGERAARARDPLGGRLRAANRASRPWAFLIG